MMETDAAFDEAYAHGFNAGRAHGEHVGYAAGVQAAREAVLSYASKRQELCRPATPCEDITAALRVAATRIDELRGEQDPTRKE